MNDTSKSNVSFLYVFYLMTFYLTGLLFCNVRAALPDWSEAGTALNTHTHLFSVNTLINLEVIVYFYIYIMQKLS